MSRSTALLAAVLCGACATDGEFLPYELEPHGQPSWGVTQVQDPKPEPAAPTEVAPVVEVSVPEQPAPSSEEAAEWDPFLDRLIGMWDTTGEVTHDGVAAPFTASQRTDRVGSLLRSTYRTTDGMEYEGVGYWRPMGKDTWQVLWLDSGGDSHLGVARREVDLVVAEYQTLGTDKTFRHSILTHAEGVLETYSTVPGPDGGWIPSAKSTFAPAMGGLPSMPPVEGTHDPVLLDMEGRWQIGQEGGSRALGEMEMVIDMGGLWLSQGGGRPEQGGFHHTRHSVDTDLYLDWMIETDGSAFQQSEGRVVDGTLVFTTPATGLRQTMTLPVGDAFEVLAEMDGQTHRFFFTRLSDSP